MVMKKKPDLVIMDINMPNMGGFQATRRIMEISPTPIVLVSAFWDPKEVTTTFKAFEAGALTVLEKPRGFGNTDNEQSVRELIQTVKLMSEVKVVTRRPDRKPKETVTTALSHIEPQLSQTEVKLVAIGASTGGPIVLKTIFSLLPKDFSVPILVVQHIAEGFLEGFTKWLTKTTGITIHIATHDEFPLPGNAYFAPSNYDMGLNRSGRLSLRKGNNSSKGICPSVSYLFRSVTDVLGPHAAGVLLTGMGSDGVYALKSMKESGAITIVQDEETSIVFGMPGMAIEKGAAQYVLPPEKIVHTIEMIVNKNH